jgi:hypothetical protein
MSPDKRHGSSNGDVNALYLRFASGRQESNSYRPPFGVTRPLVKRRKDIDPVPQGSGSFFIWATALRAIPMRLNGLRGAKHRPCTHPQASRLFLVVPENG